MSLDGSVRARASIVLRLPAALPQGQEAAQGRRRDALPRLCTRARLRVQREERCARAARPPVGPADACPTYLWVEPWLTPAPCAVYADPVVRGNTGWPASVIVEGVPDVESVTAALQTGPYGRCVYECDNDVCDNQVSRMRRSAHPASDWSHLRPLPSHHLHTPLSVRSTAQVVNFEFSSGATASFTMVAHTQLIC